MSDAAEVSSVQGPAFSVQPDPCSPVELVIKIGGSLLRDPAAFDRVVDTLGLWMARREPQPGVVLVPGGGPFADTVRQLQPGFAVDDDAAHWMAILAIDQHAHLLAARVAGGVLVDGIEKLRQATSTGAIAVLAPYRWLRAADPLPHSWSVTSDSIAAWLALSLEATMLVLVKAVPGSLAEVADPYISVVLKNAAQQSRTLHVRVVTPDDLNSVLDKSQVLVDRTN